MGRVISALVLLPLAAFCRASPTPVILISVDTLRADHVGVCGGRRVATPGIDSFAQGGTLFTAAGAQVPLTLPSHTSLLTSTYPFQNGIEENAEHVAGNLVTLSGVLRARGYQTGAFVGSVFLERQLGLDGGFDYYDSPFQFEAFSPLSGEVLFVKSRRNRFAVPDRRDGYLVIHAAERWLNERRGQPVFAFVHLFDLHAPYELPSSFRRPPGLSDYNAQLVYVDRIVSSFREALIRGGWWERSLVILLSDHGEGLGDHGEDTHGCFVYQSTLHVPLILHWPAGVTPTAPRDDRPVGLIDVAPAILEFLHVPIPPSFAGVSLLQHNQRSVYSESVHAQNAFGWAPLRALRSGAFKYIDAPHPELYDLRHDPQEARNLVAADAARARAMRAQISELLARGPTAGASSPPDQVSPQTDALLRSLGYLSPGPRTRLTMHAPDPKDRLAELHLYEKAEAEMDAVRLSSAADLLNKVLAEDPQNTLARRDLGMIYVETNVLTKARMCFDKVLAAAPDDYLSHYELGIVEERLGQPREALRQIQMACRLAPGSEQCRVELEKLQHSASVANQK
jgi:arylsulfatase A-like enzyme